MFAFKHISSEYIFFVFYLRWLDNHSHLTYKPTPPLTPMFPFGICISEFLSPLSLNDPAKNFCLRHFLRPWASQW